MLSKQPSVVRVSVLFFLHRCPGSNATTRAFGTDLSPNTSTTHIPNSATEIEQSEEFRKKNKK